MATVASPKDSFNGRTRFAAENAVTTRSWSSKSSIMNAKGSFRENEEDRLSRSSQQHSVSGLLAFVESR
jgi:hypothetical protein